VKLKPDWAFVRKERCRSLLQVGRLKDAIAECDRSIALEPDHAVTYETRGYAYLLDRNPKQARKDFDKSLKLDPNSPISLFGRGMTKGILGDIAGAKRDGAAARAIMPDVSDYLTSIHFLPGKAP
jgi:Flp pilus assembly protein TadD